MNNDVYNKGVLTVIAIALLMLLMQNSLHSSHAQSNAVQKVVICDFNDKCAQLLNAGPAWTPEYALPISGK
jgi:hypothetical protein